MPDYEYGILDKYITCWVLGKKDSVPSAFCTVKMLTAIKMACEPSYIPDDFDPEFVDTNLQ